MRYPIIDRNGHRYDDETAVSQAIEWLEQDAKHLRQAAREQVIPSLGALMRRNADSSAEYAAELRCALTD